MSQESMIFEKRIAIKFVLVVLSCVFVSGDAEVRCIESEREALLNFKNGLIDKSGHLSSWRSNECCAWHGIECSNTTGHVIALKCDNFGLQGEFRSSLVELHHLNSLELSGIDFGGIPIPEFIGSMKQLQHLSLYDSNFSGVVPQQLGNLTNLRSLALGWNSFETVPPELGNLTNLRSLDLSENYLRIVPPQLWNLTNLRSLDLSFNSLVIVPPQLGNLTNLRLLNLSANDFGGTSIPEFIGSMKQLQHLSLQYSNFSGVIPPQFGNLTNLRSLDLSFNSLTSMSLSIHGFVLESLQILNLSGNQFNGSIPDLRPFPSLTDLDLSENNFTGPIPLSLGQLSELKLLDLTHNSLEGLVSESHFIKLDKLTELHLSFNPLLHLDIAPDWTPFQLSRIYLAECDVGPYFPKWIRSQRNLSSLDLTSANIRDEVPIWLWNTSSLLDFLFISDNQISGTIPNLSSTSILYMDLSYNQFSGPIPLFPATTYEIQLSGNMFSGSISSICETHHDQLETLRLSNNLLEGQVPNCWEKMPELYSINLANNKFSGEIPGSLVELQNLRALQMHGNNLSGELPYSLRHCHRLIIIDVGGNKLTGEVPTWIGQLHNMLILNLRGNKLHGSIPYQICNLTFIQILDLSINNFSSIIPDCFNNFTVLSSKYIQNPDFDEYLFGLVDLMNENKHSGYSSFQWKGKESEYWNNVERLKLIDFSSNRLTGNIPKSFSTMRGLISLNLSRNSLTGYIILDIGNMEVLDAFDLSHNQLSGKIPTSLAKINTLGFLDLSNNDLSGKIPTGTQLQSFNASAYAGNDGLCGDPLPKCPEDILRPSTTNSKGNMNEKDNVFSFMQEVGISMGFGFIFGFWGVIGSFIWKKSWRIAFFNLLDAVGDWFYVRIVVFVSKWRRN
ncbi:receptor-like protein EIX2 [Salvia hispanica]|uniref:receptor-like protein EIX2 n=1 Tax=Salvia hispanica TaxID=49212 RepID=UPI00200999E6|nr:receptor-like protein EIX2 [Salvia hispanica]